MTNQRDSLAREIDEELRREQLLKIWDRYGTYIVVVVALLIASVGGYKLYEGRRLAAAESAGAQFVAAAREAAKDSKKPEAQKALEQVASSGPAGYGLLARLRLAAADREAGRTEKAAADFEAIAKQRSVDPLLADYAELQAATLRLDSASWTEIQNRLNPLVVDGNPWRFSARELLGLAAQKAGRLDDARTQFTRLLGDRDTPQGIGERARVMLAMLTEAELAKSPTPAAPSPPAEKAPASGDKPKAEEKSK
jgi:hypothetical protein